MKIVCKEGCNVKQMLQFMMEYIEKKECKYPLLKGNTEFEISLMDMNGESDPDNDRVIYLSNDELKDFQDHNDDREDYYNKDALTGLYNRSKYEHDIQILKTTGYAKLVCVYIDAVGLHEINNHLGHKAGDEMLCYISEELKRYFPNESIYRIGGDEFVALCLNFGIKEARKKVSDLKCEVRKHEYEISAGIGESSDGSTLDETINDAENLMRYDKMEFYRNNGGVRQIRSLNVKLEQLLLEKQDASHFLNVIAPKYKGVYMVDPEKDRCRYIYVPPYFQKMLDDNQGSFLKSMLNYCDSLVRPEYYDSFLKILNYEYVKNKIENEEIVDFTYQKLDENLVKLKITKYDQNDSSSCEQLWMFLDETEASF